jgi:hypothetical protein
MKRNKTHRNLFTLGFEAMKFLLRVAKTLLGMFDVFLSLLETVVSMMVVVMVVAVMTVVVMTVLRKMKIKSSWFNLNEIYVRAPLHHRIQAFSFPMGRHL